MANRKEMNLPEGIKSSHWRLYFLYGSVIICTFVISCSINRHSDLKEDSRYIMKAHQKMSNDIKKTISAVNPDTLKSAYSINQEVLDLLNHNQRILKDMLDLEFSRIQTERNVLEIWAAVITIVFLVFSFYSMFKTDDMLTDAHKILSSLTNMHSKAESEKAGIEGKLEGILTPYTKKANELADYVSKLESELGKISDLPERLNKIDGIDRYISTSEAKIEGLERLTEEHDKIIMSLREDVDELSSAEPDVEDE